MTKREAGELSARVAQFEEKTGCELVFHFRRLLGENPTEQNRKLFSKFKLDQTKSRRGILVTLALSERKFAVWADEAVAVHTGDKLWLGMCDHLAHDLKKGNHLKALLSAVDFAEQTLSQMPHHKQDSNELSNKPIIEGDDE